MLSKGRNENKGDELHAVRRSQVCSLILAVDIPDNCPLGLYTLANDFKIKSRFVFLSPATRHVVSGTIFCNQNYAEADGLDSVINGTVCDPISRRRLLRGELSARECHVRRHSNENI